MLPLASTYTNLLDQFVTAGNAFMLTMSQMRSHYQTKKLYLQVFSACDHKTYIIIMIHDSVVYCNFVLENNIACISDIGKHTHTVRV